MTIGTHVAAVAVCLAFTLADRGLLVNPDVSEFFYNICAVVFLPALAAWIACPAVVLTALHRVS